MLDEARASDTEGQHRATPRKLADERRRRSHETDAKLQQTRNNQSQYKSRLWSKPSQLQISYPPAVGMSQISYPAEKGIPHTHAYRLGKGHECAYVRGLRGSAPWSHRCASHPPDHWPHSKVGPGVLERGHSKSHTPAKSHTLERSKSHTPAKGHTS